VCTSEFEDLTNQPHKRWPASAAQHASNFESGMIEKQKGKKEQAKPKEEAPGN